MSDSLKSEVRFFDPKQSFAVFQRRLPHWSQAGTISFITWRTWDSIPEHVLQTWLTERDAWLTQHGIDPSSAILSTALQNLTPELLREFKLLISDRWNDHLDACHGACVLRQPAMARIVAESFRHFDGDRYELTDFVIMPNHVHILAAFKDENSMLNQCESWKHFTAVKINRILNRKGRFWQQDCFDHLVRSESQFEYLRDYIAKNPRRAKLRDGEYIHETKAI